MPYKITLMIKWTLVAAFIFIITASANAQYFYKDIVSNNQLVADMKSYKENKVKKIILKSFEDNGAESEGFFCEKKLNKDYTKTELYTRADISAASNHRAAGHKVCGPRQAALPNAQFQSSAAPHPSSLNLPNLGQIARQVRPPDQIDLNPADHIQRTKHQKAGVTNQSDHF